MKKKPRFYSLTLHNACWLLNLVPFYGMTIVEDSIFRDYEEDTSIFLAGLDGLERVVRVGSFLQTILDSMRCGYIIAHSIRIESLFTFQVATSFNDSNSLVAELVFSVF